MVELIPPFVDKFGVINTNLCSVALGLAAVYYIFILLGASLSGRPAWEKVSLLR